MREMRVVVRQGTGRRETVVTSCEERTLGLNIFALTGCPRAGLPEDLEGNRMRLLDVVRRVALVAHCNVNIPTVLLKTSHIFL